MNKFKKKLTGCDSIQISLYFPCVSERVTVTVMKFREKLKIDICMSSKRCLRLPKQHGLQKIGKYVVQTYADDLKECPINIFHITFLCIGNLYINKYKSKQKDLIVVVA